MKQALSSLKVRNTDLVRFISIIVLVFGIVEGVWGILQLCDIIASGHPRYPVTGSFYNPGPYGCLLGTVFPLALYLYIIPRNNIIRYSALFYLILAAVLLPGGMSRSGWIAAIAGSSIVLAGIYWRHLVKINSKMLIFGIVCVIIVLSIIAVGLYELKPESANGRMLLWKIALRAACNVPINGVGWHSVAGVFGEAQEEYFRSGMGSAQEVMLAGSQHYVFNEYLQMAIAFGVPAAIVFACMIFSSFYLSCRRREFGIAGMLISLATVCLSSYPFQFVEFRIFALTVIAVAFFLIENPLLRITTVGISFLLGIMFVIKADKYDIDQKYLKAQNAMLAGRYEISNVLLKDLLNHTSDPMVLNFIGKNFELLDQPDSATYYYTKATHRVPSRHYPHYLLMKLYISTRQDSLALKEAIYLLEQPPKVYSKAIEDMRYQAACYIHQHNKQCNE